MIPELVDPLEWEAISESIDSEFGLGITKAILGSRQPLFLVDGEVKRLYLVSSSWIEHLFVDDEPQPTTFSLRFLGKEFGTFVKDRLRLGLQLLPELAELTENLLEVTSQAGEAFTYGRSILKEGVVRIQPDLKRGERVLIMDNSGHCLGIASLSIDAAKIDRLAREKLVAKNLADIGWFIRRLG